LEKSPLRATWVIPFSLMFRHFHNIFFIDSFRLQMTT
jgi:uncharacterized membrane protein